MTIIKKYSNTYQNDQFKYEQKIYTNASVSCNKLVVISEDFIILIKLVKYFLGDSSLSRGIFMLFHRTVDSHQMLKYHFEVFLSTLSKSST